MNKAEKDDLLANLAMVVMQCREMEGQLVQMKSNLASLQKKIRGPEKPFKIKPNKDEYSGGPEK